MTTRPRRTSRSRSGSTSGPESWPPAANRTRSRCPGPTASGSRSAEGGFGGIDHILDRLAEGIEVGGSRERALWLLGGVDDTHHLLDRVDHAVMYGVLTRAESRRILTQAMRNQPLPALEPLPAGVLPLPEDWPPPSRDHGALAIPPGVAVRGFATAEAWRQRAEIRTRMHSGDLDRVTGLKMIEELTTEFLIEPPNEE